MDLLDFVRGVHPWAKMYRLIEKLPEGSHYRAQELLDQRLAAKLLKAELQQQAGKPATPSREEEPEEKKPLKARSSVGHTPEISLMMTLCELIQQLNSTLIAVNLPKGKKPPRVRPMPRPVSALDVLRAEHEKAQVDSVVSQLISGGIEFFDDSEV
ncbi:hypothetical protein GS415_00745 [Rhodococcus hoagii]|nr:hypothetical protein [Prescottella equi]